MSDPPSGSRWSQGGGTVTEPTTYSITYNYDKYVERTNNIFCGVFISSYTKDTEDEQRMICIEFDDAQTAGLKVYPDLTSVKGATSGTEYLKESDKPTCSWTIPTNVAEDLIVTIE